MPWTLGIGRNQVFADGQVLIEARYPNKPAPGLEMYVVRPQSRCGRPSASSRSPRRPRKDQPGRIVSKLLDGQPDDYWKGAVLLRRALRRLVGADRRRRELASPARSPSATARRTGGSARPTAAATPHEEGRGMIVGHMHALDQPGEWHWQDNTLYLIPDDGKQPDEHRGQAPPAGLRPERAGAHPHRGA